MAEINFTITMQPSPEMERLLEEAARKASDAITKQVEAQLTNVVIRAFFWAESNHFLSAVLAPEFLAECFIASLRDHK